MIRRVAFGKAIFAGALGALAWELVIRVLILVGVPMFDLVRVLGVMVLGVNAPVWQWWPVGISMHAGVGAVWAIFYAYFFWSNFDLSPMLQGIMFAALPAILSGFIMVPQMDLMINGSLPAFHVFAIGVGWLGPVTIVFGHIIYGAVMGSLYTRPVGYRVGSKVAHYG